MTQMLPKTQRRAIYLTSSVFWLLLPALLAGCLFSTNHPLAGPDGTAALFLGSDGEYSPFPEDGALHLLCDGEFLPLPLTVGSGSGVVLDWAPDGSQLLYVRFDMGAVDDLGYPSVLPSSTLYQVAADPAAEPIALHTSELPIRDAAFRADGRIAVLIYDDSLTGTLFLLDSKTGQLDEVCDAVIGFRQDVSRESLFLFIVDEDPAVTMGLVGPWKMEGNELVPWAIFPLGNDWLGEVSGVDDACFWDVDPLGEGVALALLDNLIFTPEVERDVPAVFYVSNTGAVTKIAEIGYMPKFSPAGRYLAYIGNDDGQALLYEPWTSQTYTVPGSADALTCFWMGGDRLGLVFVIGDYEAYRLAVVDLATGEISDLIK